MGPMKCGPINAHPEGVCIWVPQRGTHYRSRFIFLFVVARPLAFGSLPAPMGTPKGCPYVHPQGVHIISRDLFIRACANALRAILAKIIAI